VLGEMRGEGDVTHQGSTELKGKPVRPRDLEMRNAVVWRHNYRHISVVRTQTHRPHLHRRLHIDLRRSQNGESKYYA